MEFMVRLALIKLRGYREWTESLGFDREWRIQATQSRIFSILSVEAASVDALAVPFRHDMHLVVASNVPEYRLRYLVSRLSLHSPVPVEYSIGCGPTPRDAIDAAFFSRGCNGAGGGPEAVLLAHVDLDDITGFADKHGLYEAYLVVAELYSRLVEELREYGCIVSYLGGDNILVLLSPETDAILALEDLVEEYNAKAGIGYGATGRIAAREATRCLDEIRAGRRASRVAVCASGAVPDWLAALS